MLSGSVVVSEINYDDEEREEEIPLWSRQPWDTDRSFLAFNIYLNLFTGRSVDRAYRAYKDLQNEQSGKPPKPATNENKSNTKAVRASKNFRYWSQGKTSKGERIEGAVKWQARAEAYDDYLAKEAQLAQEENTRQRIKQATENQHLLYDAVFAQTVKAVKSYTPDEVTLNELTLALKRVVEVGEVLYGINNSSTNRLNVMIGTGEELEAERQAEKDRVAKTPTPPIEAINRVTELLLVGKERKEQESSQEAHVSDDG